MGPVIPIPTGPLLRLSLFLFHLKTRECCMESRRKSIFFSFHKHCFILFFSCIEFIHVIIYCMIIGLINQFASHNKKKKAMLYEYYGIESSEERGVYRRYEKCSLLQEILARIHSTDICLMFSSETNFIDYLFYVNFYA